MKNFNFILGKSIEDALKLVPEYTIRITYKDGYPMVVTRDIKQNRINVRTENGIIVKIDNIG